MSEISRIVDQLERAYRRDAWHGPAVCEVLADLTASDASTRFVAAAHSPWEIVLHMAAWKRTVRRRIEEWRDVEPTGAENFPEVSDTSEQAWRDTLEELEREHAALAQAVSKLDDAKLDHLSPGRDYPVYVLLHGSIQHDLYHAGQIAIMKKGRKRES